MFHFTTVMGREIPCLKSMQARSRWLLVALHLEDLSPVTGNCCPFNRMRPGFPCCPPSSAATDKRPLACPLCGDARLSVQEPLPTAAGSWQLAAGTIGARQAGRFRGCHLASNPASRARRCGSRWRSRRWAAVRFEREAQPVLTGIPKHVPPFRMAEETL